MKHATLHEIAKFGAGLVLGDMIATWWLWITGAFPMVWLGITWSDDVVLPALIFDAAIILVLIHYGWNIGKVPMLKDRLYMLIAGLVFSVIAIVHIVQVFLGLELTVAGWDVPIWLSWTAVVATTYLAYMSFRLAAKMK